MKDPLWSPQKHEAPCRITGNRRPGTHLSDKTVGPFAEERPLASRERNGSLCSDATGGTSHVARVVPGSVYGEGLALGAERAGPHLRLSPPLPTGVCSLANLPTFSSLSFFFREWR